PPAKKTTKDPRQPLKDALAGLRALETKDYISTLLELLKDDDPSVQLLAAKRLGTACKDAEPALKPLGALFAPGSRADRDLQYAPQTPHAPIKAATSAPADM